MAQCDSTNAQAAALDLSPARPGEEPSAVGPTEHPADWALVVAEEQTAGRGRLSRSWASPPGAGLLFSMALSTPAAPPHLSLLPLLVGLAVAQQVRRHGVPAQVKWPNDVVVIGAEGTVGKLGGVLLERTAEAVIVGVGLNVFAAPTAEHAPEGTSLADHGLVASAGIRETILADSAVAILDTWDALQVDRHRELVSTYRAMCATIGVQVRAALPNGSQIVGEAVDIDATGRLLVVPDGAGAEGADPNSAGPDSAGPNIAASGVVALSAADIVHLRPV